LNEDAGVFQQAEIARHVDTCPRCQETLEELTSRRGYLLALGTDPATEPPKDQSTDGNRTEDFEVKRRPAEQPVNESTDSGLSFELKGEETLERDGCRPHNVAGDTKDQYRSTDDDQADAADHPTRRGKNESLPDLPQLASYDLLEPLGEGGMGVVYKARQRGLKREVALKMIRGDRRGRPDLVARFRIEAEAVARLRHPNIVQIYEIGEAEGIAYLSLELLEGVSLADRLASNPQPGRPAAELIIKLATAVQVAHDANIVHRDLKPSNILFSGDGIPKITDFGLARLVESDSRQTESGQIMGSPSYMAPEQASGRTRDVGPAADIYALGAILYEMLTGRPPFKGETPIETIRMVIDTDPVPPSLLVDRVERDLETICLKCLAKEPNRRYTSASALATDLERYRNGETILARRTPPWERGFKWCKRHPWRASVAAFGTIITGAAILGGLAYVGHLRENERANNKRIFQAQEDFRNNNLAAARDNLREVQTRTEREPRLRELYDRAASLLVEIDRRIANEKAEDRNRARFREFVRQRDHALFLETQFTGLDLPASRKAAEPPARAALAIFGSPGPRDVWTLNPLPAILTGKEREEVRESCYELLLVVAESVEQPAEGLRWLDAAAKLSSLTPAYHLARANCLERSGNAKEAGREREAAGRVLPSTPLDHFLLGREAYQRKDWNAALAYFDLALQLRPDHFWSHCLSAICSLQLRRPQPAKADLNACLQGRDRQPEFAWLYVLRGFASYQVAALARRAAEMLQTSGGILRREVQVQLRTCEADYATALDLLARKPNEPLRYALLVNRGLLWVERHEWDRAVADFEAAIRLDGNIYLAYESLAAAREQQNKPDEALEAITRAITLRPEIVKLYRGRAAINVRRKEITAAQRTQALGDLETAIHLESPGNADVALDHTDRARLLYRDNRDNEALTACDAALKAAPDHLPAHQIRHDLLRKMKKYDELIASCNALLARGRPSADLYQLRGLARANQGDYASAIADFTQAITLKPSSAPLLVKRGELYLKTDAPVPAQKDFEEAIRLDSSNPDAYAGRGLALAALGKHSDAVADARAALSKGEPTHWLLYSAARIHAKAAVAAGGEARRKGQEAVALVTRYQDEAVALIREAVKRQPAADRAAFLRDVVQVDPALRSLRRRLQSL
jgi:serine/threonine protein kinase/tetratricopeptide (TPR) repeat protein